MVIELPRNRRQISEAIAWRSPSNSDTFYLPLICNLRFSFLSPLIKWNPILEKRPIWSLSRQGHLRKFCTSTSLSVLTRRCNTEKGEKTMETVQLVSVVERVLNDGIQIWLVLLACPCVSRGGKRTDARRLARSPFFWRLKWPILMIREDKTQLAKMISSRCSDEIW